MRASGFRRVEWAGLIVFWRLEVKLADLWWGVYLEPVYPGGTNVWICLVPCLPLHLEVWRLHRRRSYRHDKGVDDGGRLV